MITEQSDTLLLRLGDRMDRLEHGQEELKHSIESIVTALHTAMGVNIKDPSSIAAKAAEGALMQRVGRIIFALFTALCVGVGTAALGVIGKSYFLDH